MNKVKFLLSLAFLFVLFNWISCSKSRQRSNRNVDSSIAVPDNGISRSRNDEVKVKMEKEGGVYYVPVKVNGVGLRFIFDTGASAISISGTEALFLFKNGYLSENDIIGTAEFIDANGDISEGTIINLETIEIGARTIKNVKASVVHNLNAPLLLGQSALERFGEISIDYKRGEITLK